MRLSPLEHRSTVFAAVQSATSRRSRSSRPRTSVVLATAVSSPPNDAEIAERIRELRFHGSKDKRTFTQIGMNSRLDELQAAILRVLLPELAGWNDMRQAAAARYDELGLGRFVELPGTAPRCRPDLPPLRRPLSGSRCSAGCLEGGRRSAMSSTTTRRITSSRFSPTLATRSAACRRPSVLPASASHYRCTRRCPRPTRRSLVGALEAALVPIA